MKTFLLVLCLLGAMRGGALAGGPEIELDKAHIDDVVFDERGIVLKVTGTVKFFAAVVPEDNQPVGVGKWVTLTMRGGEIRYHGSTFDSPSFASYDKYHERLLALKGTDQHLQMWGTEATVTRGTLVTLITANDVYPLTPQHDERRFRWEDLPKDEAAKSPTSTPAQTTSP